jgi:four helix bundle protein
VTGVADASGSKLVKIRQFADLTVWQKAHELALFVYATTANFPERERFGITSQIRRSAASVAANIAEGFGRRTTGELLRSLRIARGEVEETRYFLILSRDLSFVNQAAADKGFAYCDTVARLINALGTSLGQRLAALQPTQPHRRGIAVH